MQQQLSFFLYRFDTLLASGIWKGGGASEGGAFGYQSAGEAELELCLLLIQAVQARIFPTKIDVP